MPADIKRELLRARHQHVLRCADAPNTDGLNKAAEASAKLGEDAFSFYKTEFEKGAPDRAAAAALAREQAGLQNDLSKQQLAVSQQERARYQGTFAPIEQSIAADAMGYDTPERRQAAATAATADVQMQLAGQRGATMRAMERSGVAPNSGQVAAMQGMLDIGGAKLKAGAANAARTQVETIGAAKKMDAAGLGRGVVSNQATTAGIALNAGNSAVGNGQAPVNIAAAGAGLMGQGFQTGMQGQQQAGNLYGQVAGIQQKTDATNAAMWQSAGQAAGAGAALFMSDENVKEDIEPVDPDKALEAVRSTPVENWAYQQGVEDEGAEMHTGPMAQDVNRTMGEGAAPAGKMIDPITVTGVTLAAVQALDQKLSKVAAAIGMGEGKAKAKPAARSAPAAMAGMMPA